MSCLRAYALNGIRTHDPLIMSREHEPLHHSAPYIIQGYVQLYMSDKFVFKVSVELSTSSMQYMYHLKALK